MQLISINIGEHEVHCDERNQQVDLHFDFSELRGVADGRSRIVGLYIMKGMWTLVAERYIKTRALESFAK